MKKLSPPLRQALVFLGTFLLSRLLFESLLKVTLSSLAWSQLPILQFVSENEIGLQVISIAFALVAVYFAELKSSSNRSHFPKVPRPHLSFDQVSVCLFFGFFVCACFVALSIFMGFSQLEVPTQSYWSLLNLAPWIIYQGLYLLLWVAVLELLRWTLFYSIMSSRLPSLLSFLFVSIFEGHLLFNFAQANSNSLLSPSSIVLCLMLSLALNSTFLYSLKRQKLVGDLYFRRVLFLGAFAFSFFHIFGQNIATWRGASILQIYPGPSELNPLWLYSLVALIIANTAFQKLLRHSSN